MHEPENWFPSVDMVRVKMNSLEEQRGKNKQKYQYYVEKLMHSIL